MEPCSETGSRRELQDGEGATAGSLGLLARDRALQGAGEVCVAVLGQPEVTRGTQAGKCFA